MASVSREQVATVWLPLGVSVLVTLIGGAAIWGAYSQRVSDLETRIAEVTKQTNQHEKQLQEHTTQIAVIDTKLDTIISGLGSINLKLDQLDQAEERRR